MRRASRVVSAGLKPQTPQMPKTPLSHGLTGLGAIKAGARKSALKSALRPAVAVAAFGLLRRQAKAGLRGQVGQAAASQQQRPAAPAAPPWISRPPLFFQEQIQGPQNAPVARFDGPGRYQSRSKNRAAAFKAQTLATAGAQPSPEPLLKYAGWKHFSHFLLFFTRIVTMSPVARRPSPVARRPSPVARRPSFE